MKQESHDDGYETCGDLDSRGMGKDFHNHSHTLGHSLSEMDHLRQVKTESKAYYQAAAELSQSSKEHKFIDYSSDMQQSGKENKFIDYQSSGSGFGMKCNNMSGPGVDPYSFSEDVSMGGGSLGCGPDNGMSVLSQPSCPPAPVQSMIMPQSQCGGTFPPMPKKRGRKKKIRPGEEGMDGQFYNVVGGKEEKVGHFKERKKHDRFNGMTEEEVQKRTLPDHLTPNLDIIIIGINPGLFAAYKGHHYAGPGNHFWKCLYLSGLTPEPMTADDDYKLLNVGIGFTNMVERATKGSADLTRKEIKRGSQVLLEKLQKFKPKIAVFNGKLIYEVFSGKKDFYFGRQPDFVDGTNTYMWVMPSSSARCAQLPRAADKVPFYAALKKFRDYLNGVVSDFDENEVVFTSSKLKHYYEPEIKDDLEDGSQKQFGYNYPPRITNGDGSEEAPDNKAMIPLVKQEDGTVLPPDQPVKKKRGRPKKIRTDDPNEQPPPKKPTPRNTAPVDPNAPKKKRGRPKKIKDDGNTVPVNNNMSSLNSQINSYTPHLPMNSCPQGYSPSPFSNHNHSHSHMNHNQSIMQYNQSSSQSPLSVNNYHQSPLPHHYTHSPQPSSLTHSDLSSEISAAISSEHNLGSPSPHSPSLVAPSSDFESTTNLGENSSKSIQLGVKTEQAVSDTQADCGFHNITSPNENQASSYQNYNSFSSNSEHQSHSQNLSGAHRQHHPGTPTHQQQHSVQHQQHSGYQQSINSSEYEPKCIQDVAAKSLSGLESLVDQIPSIADSDGPVASVNEGGPDPYPGGQPGAGGSGHYVEEAGYLTNYSSHCGSGNSHYPSSASSYSNQSPGYNGGIRMNFSISSLANSSNNSGGSSPNSNHANNAFSVSNMAQSYNGPNSYNMMGSMPHVESHHMMNRMYSSPNGSGNCDMSMSGSMGHYAYNQYSSGSASYPGSPNTAPSTPGSTPGSGGSGYYSPSHSLHMPSPSYPSPYSSGYGGSSSPYPMPVYPKPDLDMSNYGGSSF